MANEMRNYVRSSNKSAAMTVHRSECRVLTRTSPDNKWPWPWAEGRPLDEVFQNDWNRPCKVCKPETP